jgi:NAD(P)-dependent dehydrogenase (short-subunit alcohol dehydrogenase family)
MGQKLAVVVTGGTSKQGGAVVKSLIERGHEVRAVTRSTESAKARELANAGVTLVRASLEDTAALTKALEGATSLFAMTTPFEGGTQSEMRQGISAADAAKAAGVHLVFTSAGSANRQTGMLEDHRLRVFPLRHLVAVLEVINDVRAVRAAQVHEKVVAVIYHVGHECFDLFVADPICGVNVLKLFRVPETVVGHELGEAPAQVHVVLQFSQLVGGHMVERHLTQLFWAYSGTFIACWSSVAPRT